MYTTTITPNRVETLKNHMLSLFGVTVVVYFMKILSGSRNNIDTYILLYVEFDKLYPTVVRRQKTALR